MVSNNDEQTTFLQSYSEEKTLLYLIEVILSVFCVREQTLHSWLNGDVVLTYPPATRAPGRAVPDVPREAVPLLPQQQSSPDGQR